MRFYDEENWEYVWECRDNDISEMEILLNTVKELEEMYKQKGFSKLNILNQLLVEVFSLWMENRRFSKVVEVEE